MFTKVKKLIAPGIIAAGTLAAPASAFAVTILPGEIANIDNAVVIIRGIVRFILVVAFVIAFIMLLVGGIRWIIAGGDEKGVANARNTITAALIGLVIVLVAYAIIRLVELFFGVNIVTGNICVPNVGGGCQ